jgi:hypothetical protein
MTINVPASYGKLGYVFSRIKYGWKSGCIKNFYTKGIIKFNKLSGPAALSLRIERLPPGQSERTGQVEREGS